MKNLFKIEPDTLTVIALCSFILMAVVLKPSDKYRNVPAKMEPFQLVVASDTPAAPLSKVPEPTATPIPYVVKPKPTPAPYKPVYFTPTPARDKAAREYINRFEKVAVAEMDKYNIPASITLGQGILETNWGSSFLYKNALNSFGVKCFSKRCKKGHCMNREDDSHKDFFRIYPTAWESFRDHSKKISSGIYKKLPGKDYAAFAVGLKAAGYATDPNYAERLIDIIRYYQLYKLDDL